MSFANIFIALLCFDKYIFLGFRQINYKTMPELSELSRRLLVSQTSPTSPTLFCIDISDPKRIYLPPS